MDRICIVTSGHFCNNPRVWREADALTEHGYDVVVVGVWFDRTAAKLDSQMIKTRLWRFIPAADMRGHSLRSKASRGWHRLSFRVGRELGSFGLCHHSSLGYAVQRLLKVARRQRADLTNVHLQPAMWVGCQLAKEGFRIGVDIEDWYSENAPDVSTRDHQHNYYRRLEQQLLRSAVHATTTSRALASNLSTVYKVTRPVVIYNSIKSVGQQRSRLDDKTVRLLWVSQTLGRRRGLEDILLALPRVVGDWQLELRANASQEMKRWVYDSIPKRIHSRVRIEPLVPPHELTSAVQQHDVGLAVEPRSSRNNNLTASNKILQYLQSGLAVVATDTAGQKEVLDQIPGSGRIYEPGDVDSLVRILNHWVGHPREVYSLGQKNFVQANSKLAYERQTPLLLESVERALKKEGSCS